MWNDLPSWDVSLRIVKSCPWISEFNSIISQHRFRFWSQELICKLMCINISAWVFLLNYSCYDHNFFFPIITSQTFLTASSRIHIFKRSTLLTGERTRHQAFYHPVNSPVNWENLLLSPFIKKTQPQISWIYVKIFQHRVLKIMIGDIWMKKHISPKSDFPC